MQLVPRILIVSQNWDYTNPTRILLHQELQRKYGAILSGWNYSENPNDAKFKYGAIDAVIADPWAFSKSVLHHYEDLRPKSVNDYEAPVFLNLLTYDLHNLDATFFDDIVSQADYVLNACTSIQFMLSDYLSSTKQECWFEQSSVLSKNPDLIDYKFVLIPHAVPSSSYSNMRTFIERKIDISVLGAPYFFRENVREKLRMMPDCVALTKMDKIQSLMGRLSNHYIWGPKLGFTSLYRKRFLRRLENSKISVTCDGSVGYPIRKYFEIPASGALLAAKFFPQPSHLGFVDKENCIALEHHDIDDLDDMVKAARGGSIEMIKQAKAGFEMVMELHTIEKRADQIVDLVTAAINNRKVQTCWNNGELIVK